MNIFHRKSLLAACIAAMMGLHGYAQKNEASPPVVRLLFSGNHEYDVTRQ